MGQWFESIAAQTRLLRLGVRTTGFHPVNTGSIPVGDAFYAPASLDAGFFCSYDFLEEQVEYLVAVLGPQVRASVHLLDILVGQLNLI